MKNKKLYYYSVYVLMTKDDDEHISKEINLIADDLAGAFEIFSMVMWDFPVMSVTITQREELKNNTKIKGD